MRYREKEIGEGYASFLPGVEYLYCLRLFAAPRTLRTQLATSTIPVVSKASEQL